MIGENRIPATSDAFRAPTGPSAFGTPDFFDVDSEGRTRPGDWAAGLRPDQIEHVVQSEADSPWIPVGGTLLPPSVARSPVTLRARASALRTSGAGGLSLGAWLLIGAAAFAVMR